MAITPRSNTAGSSSHAGQLASGMIDHSGNVRALSESRRTEVVSILQTRHARYPVTSVAISRSVCHISVRSRIIASVRLTSAGASAFCSPRRQWYLRIRCRLISILAVCCCLAFTAAQRAQANPVNACGDLNIKRACWLRAGALSLLILYPYGYGFTSPRKKWRWGLYALRWKTRTRRRTDNHIWHGPRSLRLQDRWKRRNAWQYRCMVL